MVRNNKQETVTTTATKFVTFDPARTSVALVNLGATDIFMGSDNQVTTGNGFPISAGQAISLSELLGDDPTTERWFIVNAGTVTLAINEERAKKAE